MLLSIGMIVKNEEKYLQDCLNGIKPILEQLHSELIICDTGSTDATVEIAKEFTSKVYEIEWRGDFAWARNQGLKRAHGKWFMFLDADEIFQDVSDIVNFFNSGEYKKYNNATYRIRNINSDTSSNFITSFRIYKIDKNTRFVGKIHEHIPFHGLTKNLSSTVDHYGYFNQGAEGQKNVQRKHDRNIGPLLEQLKEKPNDLLVIHNIVQDYLFVGKLDEGKKYLDMGLEIIGSNKTADYHIFNNKLLDYYAMKLDYENIVNLSREYLNSTKKLFQVAVKFRTSETEALIKLQRYDEAVEAAKQGLDLFEKNKQGQLESRYSHQFTLQSGLLDDRGFHLLKIINAYAIVGDFVSAFYWLDEYKKEVEEPAKFSIFATFIQTCVVDDRCSDIPRAYEYAVSTQDPKVYNEVILLMEAAITSSKIKDEISSAILMSDKLIKIQDEYMLLQRLRVLWFQGFAPGVEAMLITFLNSGRPYPEYYSDVIVCAMQQNADLSKFLENMHIQNTDAFAYNMVRNCDKLYETFTEYAQRMNWQTLDISIKAARLLSAIGFAAFENIKNEKKINTNSIIEIFEASVRLKHMYLSKVYKPDIYCDAQVYTLPEIDAFIYHMGKGLELKDAGDESTYIRRLAFAMKCTTYYHNAVKLITDSLKSAEDMDDWG